jgi:hypothetical protein
MIDDDRQVLFTEVQRFRQWWLWLLIVIVAVVGWYGFYIQIVMQRPFGTNPGPDWLVWIVFLFFGLGFPLMFFVIKLVTVLDHNHLQVALRPFHSRTIPLAEIKSAAVREYRPIMEYGGWGIRWSSTHGKAYNVSGRRGVQLVLTDGRQVLIGSQRANELAKAINGAIRP